MRRILIAAILILVSLTAFAPHYDPLPKELEADLLRELELIENTIAWVKRSKTKRDMEIRKDRVLIKLEELRYGKKISR